MPRKKKLNKHVDSPFINPRILSYCPGILGLERGLKRALGPIRTVAYVEIEAFIIENLLAGMEAGLVDAAPIWCNLKTFYASPFRGAVDGIIGGYPCQPFSTAGNRKGGDDPRHLWPYIQRHINTIRPIWCFFKNVSGHLTLGFQEVRESLSNMGYAVEAGIFTAEEVGAPHERERLFILAIRRDWMADTKSIGKRSRRSKQAINSRIGEQLERTESRRNIINYGQNKLAHSKSIKGRLQLSERRSQQTNPEFVRTSKELGYTACNYERWNRLRQRGFRITIRGSSNEAVAYSDSSGFSKLRDKGKSHEKNYAGISNSSAKSTVGQADCDYPRCEEQWQCISTATGQSQLSSIDKWPARPGQEQFRWEAPRTESSVGYAIDGYNYREDLLRAAGNSVVEQTAELAFKELLQKHLYPNGTTR